ncbi:MAG: hypothetical protein JO302_00975 [Candidatus Eremiobacteraeota bacterium]|nr:hypothetical protein [Candidatus Eremiobacteraeota bacterium]
MKGRYLLLAGLGGLAIAVAVAIYAVVTRQYNPVVIAFAALFLTGSVGLLAAHLEGAVRRQPNRGVSFSVQLCAVVALAALLFVVALKIRQAMPH